MASIWDKVSGGNPSQGWSRGRLPIRRVGPGERLCAYPLEDRVSWFRTHYLGKRTRLCLADECPCLGADPEWEFKWDGWLVAMDTKRTVCLIHFTQGAFLDCERLRDTSASLVGCRVTLARREGGERGPVVCTVENNVVALRQLPTLGISHVDALRFVYFGGKDDPPSRLHLARLYGRLHPADGSPVNFPIRPAEEDNYAGEF